MLSELQAKDLDKVWRHLWSSGITNPIIVSEILSSALMALAEDPNCAEKYRTTSSSSELADELRNLRKRFGLPHGSEIESPQFWADTSLFADTLTHLPRLIESGTDLLGDAYEHILGKLSTAGHFGQFRTPRHIVNLMVRIMAPRPDEEVLDPACGSGGFLVSAGQYMGGGTSGRLHGWEIDRTIARLAISNTTLHAMPPAAVEIRDGLSPHQPLADLILANPPFSGDVSPQSAAQFRSGSSRTEVLFVEAITTLLKAQGRAAIIVPTGVLDGRTASTIRMRRNLLRENNVRHVIELPSSVFRPYADVRTAIMVIDNSVDSHGVAMFRVAHDGYSQDARRRPQPERSDLPAVERDITTGDGPTPHRFVTAEELESDDYILTPNRWIKRANDVAGQSPRLSHSVQELHEEISQLQLLASRLKEVSHQ